MIISKSISDVTRDILSAAWVDSLTNDETIANNLEDIFHLNWSTRSFFYITELDIDTWQSMADVKKSFLRHIPVTG